MIKYLLKILLTIVLIFSYLLTFYAIARYDIELVEILTAPINSLIGDYRKIFLLVVAINIALILFSVLGKDIKGKTKANYALSILVYPFYNVYYIWRIW